MIKAIETVYNGYRFRSRLEARWAVFFDTLGIKYEYEKEGFDLGGVDDIHHQDWYLPDFWLPEQDCWIEIKGQKPTDEEERLADLLSYQKDENVFIFFGNIGIPITTARNGKICEISQDDNFKGALGFIANKSDDFFCMTNRAVWSECSECGCLKIRDAVDFCTLPWCCQSDFGAKIDTPRLITAYTAARQARFEHGEKG